MFWKILFFYKGKAFKIKLRFCVFAFQDPPLCKNREFVSFLHITMCMYWYSTILIKRNLFNSTYSMCHIMILFHTRNLWKKDESNQHVIVSIMFWNCFFYKGYVFVCMRFMIHRYVVASFSTYECFVLFKTICEAKQCWWR
jgi:hypothetical protein